ncbi:MULTISPECIES: Na+/H+ antiporter NhaA [Rhodomicrobium]|uniref:Na+/H+ antiporter NhaA n=1 Tax=Rhodomicrobium TaxID=1068 RepID=UPI000B4A84BF|nr:MULTISPECIES: Na+/H+ antiporter NhaA [Rhodomicrobium]
MAAVSRASDAIREFLRLEQAGGVLLVMATLLAILLANSPLSGAYRSFLEIPGAIQIGALNIAKPLILWVNDGLMAVFFFLIGLEIKREFKIGELSSISQVVLPGLAAIGGMAAPALIYIGINWGLPQSLNGWAIPAATDIAFALAVLSLLGNRVPASLKILLLAIAIFDDLGAIVIIAFFYSGGLSHEALLLALVPIAALVALNLRGVTSTLPYLLVGIVLWVLVLKSGVHATLAGVITALAIPLAPAGDGDRTVLEDLEHALHPWVAFAILPLFAFANAGVSFEGIGLESLYEPVTLGIALGLFAGKQIGIFGMLWLAIILRISPMPKNAHWLHLYGVSAVAGIGFTMSLFIGSLAFSTGAYEAPVRLGVLVGSLACAGFGYVLLRLASRPDETSHKAVRQAEI